MTVITIVTFGAAAGTSALPRQDIYALSNFKVSEGSNKLPPSDRIADGTLVINKSTNTVTLHLERNYYCPPNSICTEQMPEPLIIELPITYIGTGFCGGEVISAELDARPANGTYLGVHLANDEGNNCTKPNQDDRGVSKPITIQFAEQGAHEAQPTVSQFQGQLIGIQP